MSSDVNATVEAVLQDPTVFRAIRYISPTCVARATRRRFKAFNKKQYKNHPVAIVIHVGRPNYRERDFIKAAKKAGEEFPIRKVQLQRNAVR